MAKRVTKQQKVLEHLQRYGNITSMQAIELYGATRLAAIIFNLRKKGHDIETLSEKMVDRYGEPDNYGRYIYKGLVDMESAAEAEAKPLDGKWVQGTLSLDA